ncbi:Alpha/Beta hydrolase protein [Mycena vulgaris]|nr:Alpha/Beta hydrolase protein [Mycena vulgaris]
MLLHCFVLLLALPAFPTALEKTGPVVSTSSGSYIGVRDSQNQVDAFKGIRFASHAARFEPTAPVANMPAGAGSQWNDTSLVRRSVATKRPVIFAAFNYRLGFLGSAQAPASALNVGLQDQRDALKWIQDNGSRITISGESAGGTSVNMHYLYPDSRQIFRARISSSGTSLRAQITAGGLQDHPGGAYQLLLEWPIITGTNRNEGTFAIGTALLDLSPQPPIDEDNPLFGAAIASEVVNNATVSQDTPTKLLDLYAHPTDNLSNSTLFNRSAQCQTDFSFLTPQRLFLKTASAETRAQDVWAYSFDQLILSFPDFLRKLKSQMQDFYISFVNDLNPGASWPKYSEESKLVMLLCDRAVGPILDSLRRN